jgi:hypothetical protein
LQSIFNNLPKPSFFLYLLLYSRFFNVLAGTDLAEVDFLKQPLEEHNAVTLSSISHLLLDVFLAVQLAIIGKISLSDKIR